MHGVKIDKNFEYVGNFGDLLNPYALLGGLVTLTLFTFHGTVFVGLKTVGDIRERARKLSLGVGLVAAVVALVFLIWTQADNGDAKSRCVDRGRGRPRRRDRGGPDGARGWAFALSGLTIVAAVAMLFLTLFPNVMPSSLNADWSLTVSNASSSPYTLRDHDLVRGNRHTDGSALPVVDVLGVPQEDRYASHRRGCCDLARPYGLNPTSWTKSNPRACFT